MSAINELKKILQEAAEEQKIRKAILAEEAKKAKIDAEVQLRLRKERELQEKHEQEIRNQVLKEQESIIVEEQLVEVPKPNEIKEETSAQKTAKLLDAGLFRKKQTFTEQTNPRDIEKQRWQDPVAKQNFVTFKDMNDHYGAFLARIQQQMGTIGGGGEVNLRGLDDVDSSTIEDGLFLKYDSLVKKFVFDSKEITTPAITTHAVTTATYTVEESDSYLGVNFAGEVNITLPSAGIVNGRVIYFKDESGAAETNPINVIGTVDNDPDGFSLQVNNGSITLVYRNGWRIV